MVVVGLNRYARHADCNKARMRTSNTNDMYRYANINNHDMYSCSPQMKEKNTK